MGLNHIMETYDVVELVNGTNTDVETNTCVHWSLEMIKKLKIPFNEDTLFDFFTKYLLDDPNLQRRYLSKLVKGRALRGVNALLTGADPTRFQERRDFTPGHATVVATAPKDKRSSLVKGMMKEFFAE